MVILAAKSTDAHEAEGFSCVGFGRVGGRLSEFWESCLCGGFVSVVVVWQGRRSFRWVLGVMSVRRIRLCCR